VVNVKGGGGILFVSNTPMSINGSKTG